VILQLGDRFVLGALKSRSEIIPPGLKAITYCL